MPLPDLGRLPRKMPYRVGTAHSQLGTGSVWEETDKLRSPAIDGALIVKSALSSGGVRSIDAYTRI